jgi:hypothetical protein
MPGAAGKLPKKAPQAFSAQDALAALPRNCQTTTVILGWAGAAVNVTLVILTREREGVAIAAAKANRDDECGLRVYAAQLSF